MLKTPYTPQVVQSIAKELAGVRRPDRSSMPTLSDVEDLPKLDGLGLVEAHRVPGLVWTRPTLRHAEFVGLRGDKPAQEVRREM